MIIATSRTQKLPLVPRARNSLRGFQEAEGLSSAFRKPRNEFLARGTSGSFCVLEVAIIIRSQEFSRAATKHRYSSHLRPDFFRAPIPAHFFRATAESGPNPYNGSAGRTTP